jgi:hypothetical protein
MRVIYKCRKRVYSKLSHKTLSLASFRRAGAVRVYELPVLGVVTVQSNCLIASSSCSVASYSSSTETRSHQLQLGVPSQLVHCWQVLKPHWAKVEATNKENNKENLKNPG